MTRVWPERPDWISEGVAGIAAHGAVLDQGEWEAVPEPEPIHAGFS